MQLCVFYVVLCANIKESMHSYFSGGVCCSTQADLVPLNTKSIVADRSFNRTSKAVVFSSEVSVCLHAYNICICMSPCPGITVSHCYKINGWLR